MAKVAIEDIELTLRKKDVSPEIIRSVLADLAEQLEMNASEKTPRQKKELMVIASDYGEGNEDTPPVGWVVQVAEGRVHPEVVADVVSVANDFNETKKGKKFPVETLGDTFEAVPARFFKERGISVKTKIPLVIHKFPNNLKHTLDA